MDTQIVLFEDHLLCDMSPITLTRPAFAVTCACYTLFDIVSAAAGGVGWAVRDYLSKSAALRYARQPLGAGPKLFLNASIVPDVRYAERIRALAADARPFVATAGGRVSAAFLPAGVSVPSPLTSENVTPWLLELKLPLHDDEYFKTLDHQYEVIKYMEPLFPGNIAERIRTGSYREWKPGVFCAENVFVADTAVFRTREGPVVLEREVEALDFTYFVGPVHVGQNLASSSGRR
jgi:hypothetical protein